MGKENLKVCEALVDVLFSVHIEMVRLAQMSGMVSTNRAWGGWSVENETDSQCFFCYQFIEQYKKALRSEKDLEGKKKHEQHMIKS